MANYWQAVDLKHACTPENFAQISNVVVTRAQLDINRTTILRNRKKMKRVLQKSTS